MSNKPKIINTDKALSRFEERQAKKEQDKVQANAAHQDLYRKQQGALEKVLKERSQALLDHQTSDMFGRGDLVQWKPGLKNRPFPPSADTMIVMDAVDNIALEGMAVETCTLKVGVLLPDQMQPDKALQFIEVLVDHRRLQHQVKPEEKKDEAQDQAGE